MNHVRPEVQVIRRCQAVLPDRVLPDACLRIEHGQIAALGPESPDMLAGASHVIDANGRTIGPGFVDVHCHGDGTRRFVDAPEAVALELLRQGTTTVLATVGYTDMEPDLVAQLHHFDSALGEWGRESVAGFHLEGPYVNRKYGAQTARGLIKDPEPAEYREWLRAHGKRIRWWTCAPELPGADAFIRAASAAGVVVAAGHTEATPDELSSAVRAGLKVATHWSNATGNTRGRGYRGTRIPGVDEAALVFDELSAEVIPDQEGLHVHPLMLRLLLKAKGTDRILIITDAAYRRANDPIGPADAVRDVSIDAFGDLAGSRLTMAGAARNFRRFTGCAWPELFRMASLNAARLLGLEAQIGSLEIGKRANLILFEDELQGLRTFLAGREVPLRP
jgi:N-acetylglucosamine-6-phosphate deacetylase